MQDDECLVCENGWCQCAECSGKGCETCLGNGRYRCPFGCDPMGWWV